MPARQLCPKVNPKIRGVGVDFAAYLIVLESKGIDVVLGMDWLSKAQGTYRLCQKVCQVDYSRRKGNGVCRRAGSHCQGCC
jgi:hypothetical protein